LQLSGNPYTAKFGAEILKHLTFICVFALGYVGSLQASERRLLSGNDVLAGCRLASELKVGKSVSEAYLAGDCAGTVRTLAGVGSHLQTNMRFCVPGDIVMLQAPKVVVHFLETHPERLHEPAIVLMIDALRSAWPCAE
jgi:Rap1a immunity proteins